MSSLLDNHTPMLKNLAKPSTMASETHASNVKVLPNHPTWQSHLSPVTSLTENLSSSRYSPRIISGTLQPKNRSSCSIIFNQLSDRRDILPDHPTRQSHFLPVTSWPGNLLSSSRYGPRICRQRVTARIRSSSHYSPENLFVT